MLEKDFEELLAGQPKCALCKNFATRVLQDGQLRCDEHSVPPFSSGPSEDLPTADVIRRTTMRCRMLHVHGVLCRRKTNEQALRCTLKAGHEGEHNIEHDCGTLDPIGL